MRLIKFRAYHPDSGMKYFILNQIKGGTVLFDDGDWRSLNDCQVMQFTDLHDKNGKEIYEGDILNWVGLTLLNDNICRAFVNKGEVIGNIYENPEQLEKGKK